jgi:predicted HAD superfamily Cof-like phosphohydrolase
VITQDQIDEWEESESYYSGIEPETRDHMTVSEMVQEFAKVTGQKATYMTYLGLIEEEFDEFMSEDENTVGELKELADLLYVIYGYARIVGYDLDTAVRRVHENNIGRCVQPDGTVKRRPDGKIQKREDYPKVKLEDLV